MVFLYDRHVRRRIVWGRSGAGGSRYYLGLALDFVDPAGFISSCIPGHARSTRAAGNFSGDISPEGYWLTQFHAITRYLALVAWPRPLVFDYGTQAVPSFVVGISVGGGRGDAGGGHGVGTSPRPACSKQGLPDGEPLALPALGFFATLAPTSLVPVIVQVMAEHRMYLALAPVVAVAVVGGYGLLELSFSKAGISRSPIRFYLPLCLAAAAGLGFVTARRNVDYRAELTLWGKTAAQCPGNPRAQYNFGLGLSKSGNLPAAIEHYREALRLKPDYTEAHNNLGIALSETGHWTEAIAEYEEAARLDPGAARIRYNLGNAFLHVGKLEDAIANYEDARRLSDDSNIEFNLGLALTRAGRAAEAVPGINARWNWTPILPRPGFYLSNALLQLGRAGTRRSRAMNVTSGSNPTIRMPITGLPRRWSGQAGCRKRCLITRKRSGSRPTFPKSTMISDSPWRSWEGWPRPGPSSRKRSGSRRTTRRPPRQPLPRIPAASAKLGNANGGTGRRKMQPPGRGGQSSW